MSPQLTVLYNPEFTARWFERLPWLAGALNGALGLLGPMGEPTPDVSGTVARLEVGFMLMILAYVTALFVLDSNYDSGPGAMWLVVGFAMAFRVTFFLLPGLFSTD